MARTTQELTLLIGDIRMTKPVEKFYEPVRVYLSQTEDTPVRETSTDRDTAPENGSVSASSMLLELRREGKEDDMQLGESRVGKMCVPRGWLCLPEV